MLEWSPSGEYTVRKWGSKCTQLVKDVWRGEEKGQLELCEVFWNV